MMCPNVVFPVRNYPPSVGHVHQNTLRWSPGLRAIVES